MSSPAAPTVIAAAGVGRAHGRHAVLTGVDLTLAAGEAVALLGPNGAGKTSLLELLAAVVPCRQGTITPPDGGRAATGWVPQRAAVYPRLSVRENLRLFVRLAGAPATRVDDLIAAADLSAVADRAARALSTGTLQRLNVAVALTGDPALLLLDEPTATLSPDQRPALWRWLTDLRRERGMALLFSTQSTAEAREHADRTLVLVDGRPAFTGTIDELVAAHSPGDGDGDRAFLALVTAANAERAA